jgi:hypothetical protein
MTCSGVRARDVPTHWRSCGDGPVKNYVWPVAQYDHSVFKAERLSSLL